MDPALPTPTTTATPECGFEGNSDIYGLGIRLGIYLQWLAAIAAELASPADVEAAHAAAASYQLAMLSGLVLVTQDRGLDVRAVEAFLILLFCFAGAWVASVRTAQTSGLSGLMMMAATTRPGSSESDALPVVGGGGGGGGVSTPLSRHRRSAATGLLRQLLGCAVCAYGNWTLFVGLDNLPRTPCDEVAFFFARVPLFGWFRDMFKAFFVISLVASSALLAVEAARRGSILYAALREWPPKSRVETSLSSPPEDGRGGAAVFGDGKPTVLLRQSLGGVAALGLFVATIELTLWWNAVRGVYGCENFGQLFPVVLSASNLVRVCGRVAKAIVTRNVSVKL